MTYLYRGINLDHYINNEKTLAPKGTVSKGDLTLSQWRTLSDVQTLGPSEENAVQEHQYCDSVIDDCYISTSTDFNVAADFATKNKNGHIVKGVVLTIDTSLFKKYGITKHPIPIPRYNEKEVSIKAKDNGPLTNDIIIKVTNVERDQA
jgi:hypothetical protein